MKDGNRWIYVAGVAVLAILAVGGYFLSVGDGDESPAGDAGGDVADGGAVVADGAAVVDGAGAADGPAAVELLQAAEALDAAPIPEGNEACRAYCQRLSESGDLAEGTTLANCIEQLCSEQGEEAPEGETAQPVMSESELPERSDDCREQCQIFERRGELRAGTTIEDCFAAMCSEASEEE